MKKILIFSMAYYPRFTGGAEAAIKEITDRIDDIEFHLLTLRYDSNLLQEEKIGNVIVHRMGFAKPDPEVADLKRFPLHFNKHWYQVAAGFKARSLHKKIGFDGAWAMMAHSAGVPVAVFNFLQPNVKFALTLQEGDPIEHIERTMAPLWLLFTRSFTQATVVQAISDYLAEWARARGFKGPLEMIRNGANPGDFKAGFSQKEIEGHYQRINKQEGTVDLVTASRLVKKNGVDLVIKALPMLPANVRFIVVGGGPDMEMLQDLAQTEGVADRVVFIGQIDRSEVPLFRYCADIFIRPSRTEGLGNAMLSAMAARKPVIATQAGGIAEYLFDQKHDPDREQTGWVVEQEDPESIATAVKDILAHPEKVRTVTDTAYKMVDRHYNWDNISRDMREKVFGRILK